MAWHGREVRELRAAEYRANSRLPCTLMSFLAGSPGVKPLSLSEAVKGNYGSFWSPERSIVCQTLG